MDNNKSSTYRRMYVQFFAISDATIIDDGGSTVAVGAAVVDSASILHVYELFAFI